MKKGSAEYNETLREATAWLFDEFLRWNETQGELKAKGYPNNHYGDGEVAQERRLFQAIAERFVLEDVDFSDWQWFETPWSGTDANTGREACIVDFVTTDDDVSGWGILAFYVTRNRHFWYALPLAEMPSEEGISTYEVNCIQDALDALVRAGYQASSEEEGDSHG